MLKEKVNLSLKFNKSLNNLNVAEQGPYTPLEQTISTPLEQPWGPDGHAFDDSRRHGSVYDNPQYNESDDFLGLAHSSDLKTTRTFTVNFAPDFDNLVWGIYSHFLSLPTTTPFSGNIPPSGLVSKVANETMTSLLSGSYNATYDHQHIITPESLSNHGYQPIFLQLIRKRFLDLCTYNVEGKAQKLPESTTVSITLGANGAVSINSYSGTLRQSSISNLSLTDLNISNYNNANGQASANRSRNSSMSLRKQSLTRNNSHSGNNWIHVGNINSIRPPMHDFSASTDSLQSMQDYVPQSFINRSAAGVGEHQTPPAPKNSLQPAFQTQTPPNMLSSYLTYEDYPCDGSDRSRSSSIKSNSFPRPLTINTSKANAQAMNALMGTTTPIGIKPGNYDDMSLDSPFLSATTPAEDYGYLYNGFAPLNGGSASSSTGASPVNIVSEESRDRDRVNLPAAISLSEKKRDSLKMKRGIH